MENQKVRVDLVAHLREQIERGTYVTEKKLEIAAKRLLERLVAETKHES